MEKKKQWYEMTLTGEQAWLIARALDLYSRAHAGQISFLREVSWRKPKEGFQIDHGAVDKALDDFKRAAFPDLPMGAADFNFKGGKECFNLRKLLEHATSWTERPPESHEMFLTVNYDRPLEGWWEDEPARIVAVEGSNRRRIRDKDGVFKVSKRLEDALGTDDAEEAIDRILEWKKFYQKNHGSEVKKDVTEESINHEDLWNLDVTLARIILPYLRVFREHTIAYPASMKEKTWNKYLLQMERAFEIIIREDGALPSPEEDKAVERGLKLFAKYFQALWW